MFARRKLREDALEKVLENENLKDFKLRLLATMQSIPSDVIDRTIASLPKRMDLIVKGRGERIKY